MGRSVRLPSGNEAHDTGLGNHFPLSRLLVLEVWLVRPPKNARGGYEASLHPHQEGSGPDVSR